MTQIERIYTDFFAINADLERIFWLKPKADYFTDEIRENLSASAE